MVDVMTLLAIEDVKVHAAAWANQTNAQPIGLALLGSMILMVLIAPRRWSVVPFFVLACFAARQRVVVAGLDFDFIRILILVGWLRVSLRREVRVFRWITIDTIFALWSATTFLVFVILMKTESAFTVQLGKLLSTAGGYFLFRILIRTREDLWLFARTAALIAAPVMAFFIIEKMTARNLFASFGGISELTQIRDGRIRAQGAFAHPILAGCFWAAMIPLFASLWFRHRVDRILAVVGVAASLVIVVATSSSTPIVSVAAAALAGVFFVLRHRMRMVRYGILGMLLVLQAVTTKPVWHLFVYADIIGGSTGWHRYHLIDQAIKHFPEWMLFGTKSTAHWGPGLSDITNQFVLEGVQGGLITLVLFVILLSLLFGAVGRTWRVAPPQHPGAVALSWALGVALFVHVTSFMAVSYFGQIDTLLVIHFAAIASLAPPLARTQPRQLYFYRPA